MGKFRFQDLEIWKKAIELGDTFYDIADDLESKKLFRFAEQLRSAGMSISNNIAEGSGSNSRSEFIRFLTIAKRSAFETVNILVILDRRKFLNKGIVESLAGQLEVLCRQITTFQRSLR